MSKADTKADAAPSATPKEFNFPEGPDEIVFEEPPPPPKDIAFIAAEILLRKAASAANLPAKVEPGTLLIVRVPSPAWISPTANASPPGLLNCFDEDENRRQRGSRSPLRKRNFSIFEKTERSMDRNDDRFIEEVAGDIRNRTTCIIISADPESFIAPLLRQMADYVLALPSLDEASLLSLVEQITGSKPSKFLPEVQIKDLSPHGLRLAFRPGESADQYLNRLKRTFVEPTQTQTREAKIKLENLYGMDEVVAWAKSLAVDISNYRCGIIVWSEVDPGALLIGAPGTGKTTAAAAIASFCQLALVTTSYASWQASGDGHLGEVVRAIRNAFTEAREKSPSLLFIDELDSVSSRDKQTGYKEWWTSIVNCLLEELDGVKARDGVVVVGATNHPDRIDPAIRRAGRLDREIRIYLPDPAAIIGILQNYVGQALSPQELERAANLCAGKTGAQIEQLVRGAKRRARNEKTDLNYQHILSELSAGSTPRNSQEILRTAVHEAGHAIAIMVHNPTSPPTISISPGGIRGGQALFLLDDGDAITPDTIHKLLVTLLAGRAAEEVVFGNISAGAGGSENSDLAIASKLATNAELSLGLGSSGILWSQISAPEELPASLATRAGAEQAVRKKLQDAYENAKTLISEHQTQLAEIADALIECTVLSPLEVAEIFTSNMAGKQTPLSQDGKTHQ